MDKEIIIMKTSSLRRKFIIFVIIIIIPLATNSMVSLIISKQITYNYDIMLNKMSTTNEIKASLNDSFKSFNEYILVNSNKSKESYDSNYTKSLKDVLSLEKSSDLQSRYILRDLLNSLRSFKDSGDTTIKISSNQAGIDVYYEDYTFTKEVFSYCNNFISKLSDSY